MWTHVSLNWARKLLFVLNVYRVERKIGTRHSDYATDKNASKNMNGRQPYLIPTMFLI